MELGPEGVAGCVRDAGIGFMYAPHYHPAMRMLRGVRGELKVAGGGGGGGWREAQGGCGALSLSCLAMSVGVQVGDGGWDGGVRVWVRAWWHLAVVSCACDL